MNYILDDSGNPVLEPDIVKFGWWFQTADRQIRRDSITPPPFREVVATVSTIFLGIDHQFGLGQPLLFETMVFGGDDDGYQDRYSTLEEAIAGHENVVAMLTAGKRLTPDE